MSKSKDLLLTARYVQLFVNAQGKMDVDRIVEARRMLEVRLVGGSIQLAETAIVESVRVVKLKKSRLKDKGSI